MQKRRPLQFLTLVRGALKKMTTNFPVKIVFTCFSMGLTQNFHGKKGGPWIFFSSERGPRKNIRSILNLFWLWCIYLPHFCFSFTAHNHRFTSSTPEDQQTSAPKQKVPITTVLGTSPEDIDSHQPSNLHWKILVLHMTKFHALATSKHGKTMIKVVSQHWPQTLQICCYFLCPILSQLWHLIKFIKIMM